MNKSLKLTLRLNAFSCLLFGIAFTITPNPIGVFLDGVNPSILRLVGIGLTLHGLHLLIASLRKSIGLKELAYFIVGDILWIIASLILTIWIPEIIHSPTAISTTLIVATWVGSMAALQIKFGSNILKP